MTEATTTFVRDLELTVGLVLISETVTENGRLVVNDPRKIRAISNWIDEQVNGGRVILGNEGQKGDFLTVDTYLIDDGGYEFEVKRTNQIIGGKKRPIMVLIDFEQAKKILEARGLTIN